MRLLKVEAIASGSLMTTPVWVSTLSNVSLIASTIAAVCGAIYGIYTVVRIYKLWREKKRFEKDFDNE